MFLGTQFGAALQVWGEDMLIERYFKFKPYNCKHSYRFVCKLDALPHRGYRTWAQSNFMWSSRILTPPLEAAVIELYSAV